MNDTEPFARTLSRSVALVALLVAWQPAGSAQAPPSGILGRSTPSSPQRLAATDSLKRRYLPGSIPNSVVLDPAPLPSLQPRRANEPLQIGFSREIPSELGRTLEPPNWVWTQVGVGSVATLSVRSPDAAALRLALQVRNLPAGVELRFFGFQSGDDVSGPFTADDVAAQIEGASPEIGRPFWSPVVSGDTIAVEIHVPSASDVARVSLSATSVSHLLMNPARQEQDFFKASSPCEIDVACHPAWSAQARSVARMTFIDGGESYLCTGTLLNDRAGTSSPYFLTANHCFDNASAAATLNTFWFEQHTTCGGTTVSPVTTLTRGAILLATSSSTDFTFLRLNEPAPAGAFFAGWRSGSVSPGLAVAGIHHPEGDPKKISFGTLDGISRYFEPATGLGTHLKVTWSQGLTEVGSSGSGLFANDGTGQLLGILSGGTVACTGASDWYGRFELIYPAISQFLDAASPGGSRTAPGQAVVEFNSDCSVTLRWPAATGPVTQYAIVAQVNGVPAGVYPLGSEPSVRSGALSPGTYQVIVRARFSDGAAIDGPPATFVHTCGGTPGPFPPPSGPLTAPSWLPHSVNASDVTLNWTLVAGASGYDIEAIVQATGQVLNVPVGNQSSLPVANVPPGVYVLRIRARSSTAAGPYSAPLTVVVGGGGPGLPPAPQGETLITLTWNTTADMDLHVVEPSGAHVYYLSRRGPTALLEADDVDGFGPERISIRAPASGLYQVYVVQFSGGPTASSVTVTLNAGTPSAQTGSYVVQTVGGAPAVGYNVVNVSPVTGQLTPTAGTRAADVRTAGTGKK